MKQQRGAPHVFQVFQAEVNVLTDDAGIPGHRGADKVRRQLQYGVAVERGGQPFLGQFDAVALHAGEADFQVIAFRANSFDLDGLAGRLWGRHHWFGGEVERYPQDVGVFDVEQALFIEVVGLAAQGSANHLLAQQLGAEGTHAQHMRDIAWRPSLR